MQNLPVFSNNYIIYNEYIAANHPAIRHRKETGAVTFDVVRQSDIKSLDITKTAINAAATIAMLCIVPTKQINSENTDNDPNIWTCGFIILKRTSTKGSVKNAWWNSIYEAEYIAYQILHRFVADSKKGYKLFARQADTLGALNPNFIPKNIEGWEGFLVTYNLKTFTSQCYVPPCDWLDNGITPLNI